MPKNESIEFFLRFLTERFQAFRNALSSFLNTLTLEDRQKKLNSAQNVVATLDDLKRAMSANDHPTWIAPLEHRLAAR